MTLLTREQRLSSQTNRQQPSHIQLLPAGARAARVTALVADVAHLRVGTVLRQMTRLQAAQTLNLVMTVRGNVPDSHTLETRKPWLTTTTTLLGLRTVPRNVSLPVAVIATLHPPHAKCNHIFRSMNESSGTSMPVL